MTAGSFPVVLKQLRTKRGVSQKIVAECCGFSQAELSRYEQGKRRPTTRRFILLAEYFDVPVDELCGDPVRNYRNNIDNHK